MTCQNMATEAEQISITRKNAVIIDKEIMDIHGCQRKYFLLQNSELKNCVEH